MSFLKKYFIRNSNKEVKNNTPKEPDLFAIKLTSEFTEAFTQGKKEHVDSLADSMIEAAGAYWMKCDFISFSYLLHAAEQSAYIYKGKKYPNCLLAELIKKQREG